MTPLFTKLLQYIKDECVIAANNYKIVSNGLLALAKINFYKFLKTIKPLIDGIILIAKVIVALTEMALFLLFISMKPLPAKIKTGIKAFFALSKATLYSLTKGIILTSRVLFAIIRFTLFLLLLIVRELLVRIKTAAKAFYALVKVALRAILKGIKKLLAGIKAATKAFYVLIKAALRAAFKGIKTLLAAIKAATKALYAFIKVVLHAILKGIKASLSGIKAATKTVYAFFKAILLTIIKGIKALFAGIKAAIKAFFNFIKNGLCLLIKNIKALLSGIKIAIKSGLSGINKFISSIRKKLAAWENRFVLRQKLRLLKIRNRVKQSPLANKLKQYALLIRLDKPIGILLLLWPTLIALWIAAGGWPDTDVLLVFVACVFLMRSAGCAINDYADRHIDCKVSRTKDRPLTSGKISEKEALAIFALLCIIAFGLVLLMNPLTIMMSFIGLVLAGSYPFMKRHTYLPQIHLGAAFGWAVPMAYAAQANELSQVTWLLFIATVLWTTAYDTMYAMVDREDDLKIGVKSTAILFEDADKLIIGIIQALLIICLIMIGHSLELGGFYYAGLLVATYLLVWQQYLIRHRKPAQCFQAFLNNNWFGLAVFVGVFLEYQIGGITS